MGAAIEIIGKGILVFFDGTLEVGLKPHDPNGGDLPIVSDLTTTDEAVGILLIGASKTLCRETAYGVAVHRHRNRAALKSVLTLPMLAPRFTPAYQPVQL